MNKATETNSALTINQRLKAAALLCDKVGEERSFHDNPHFTAVRLNDVSCEEEYIVVRWKGAWVGIFQPYLEPDWRVRTRTILDAESTLMADEIELRDEARAFELIEERLSEGNTYSIPHLDGSLTTLQPEHRGMGLWEPYFKEVEDMEGNPVVVIQMLIEHQYPNGDRLSCTINYHLPDLFSKVGGEWVREESGHYVRQD